MARPEVFEAREGEQGPLSPSTSRAQNRLRPLMQMSLFLEKVSRCSRMCSNSLALCSSSTVASVRWAPELGPQRTPPPGSLP